MDFNIGAALYFAARGCGCLVDDTFFTLQEWKDFLSDTAKMNCLNLHNERKKSVAAPVELNDDVGCKICNLKSKLGCVHESCKLCCKKLSNLAVTSDDSSQNGNTALHVYVSGRGDVPIPVPSRRICEVHGSRDKSLIPKFSTATVNGLEPAFNPKLYYGKQYDGVGSAVFVGQGADELLGGYGRHKTAQKYGLLQTRQELLKDLRRLWIRNLGRDDRLITFHGKYPQLPYLDDRIINFICHLPFEWLLGPDGAGSKWILRTTAQRMGLARCATFKKRAIQFGSRSDRLLNPSHFGSNRKTNGDAIYQLII